jgi:hypothetical protein
MKFVSYEPPIHIKSPFTKEELQQLQSCTDHNNDVTTECYQKLHTKVVSKIKESVGSKYFYCQFARFSNNNNVDGQSYHRDTKPKFSFRGKYPNVYTCILYLDSTGIYIGNNKVTVSPGDIVIFNSCYMHKSIGLDPFSSTKQRRVLQLFECFFDEKEKNAFFNRTIVCNHYGNNKINKYLYKFIDPRWFFEYIHFTQFFSKDCDSNKDSDFIILLNKSHYIRTIDGVKYYRDT